MMNTEYEGLKKISERTNEMQDVRRRNDDIRKVENWCPWRGRGGHLLMTSSSVPRVKAKWHARGRLAP